MLNKLRDVENGVRALLREAGLKVGTLSRKDFSARVRELADDGCEQDHTLDPVSQ